MCRDDITVPEIQKPAANLIRFKNFLNRTYCYLKNVDTTFRFIKYKKYNTNLTFTYKMYNIVIAQTRFNFIGKREKKFFKSISFFLSSSTIWWDKTYLLETISPI